MRRLSIAFVLVAACLGGIAGAVVAADSASAVEVLSADVSAETVPIILYRQAPPAVPRNSAAWALMDAALLGLTAMAGIALGARWDTLGRRPAVLGVGIVVIVGAAVGAFLADGWWWPVARALSTSGNWTVEGSRVYRPVPLAEGGLIGTVLIGLTAAGGVAVGRRQASGA